MPKEEKKEVRKTEELRRIPSEDIELKKAAIRSAEVERIREAAVRSAEIEKRKAQAREEAKKEQH